MIIYRQRPRVRGFLFDIDSTLYRNDAYFHHQHDVQIARLAHNLNNSQQELEIEIEKHKRSFADQNGGRKLSLSNIFLKFGVDIKTSVSWREELITPELFLKTDSKLVEAMSLLREKGEIVCVTNNPRSIGLRTLEALGVCEKVKAVLGMDEFYLSKPNPEIFEAGFKLLDVDPAEVLAVGDRYAVDLEEPEKMGAAAVLVESMEDVYQLPSLITRWQMEEYDVKTR